MIKIYIVSILYSTRYSCTISTTLEFTKQIFEICANLMKIRPVGA
jgi:hypothetical protein